MSQEVQTDTEETQPFTHLARIVLVTLLLTFILARVIVFLIMSRTIPDLYLHLGGTHVHHLNYGIFLLSIVGGYLLLRRPAGRSLEIAALVYGIGIALTFDEFGMWIRLGGSYWQRASWDAIIVLAAAFALLAFAPSLKKFRPRHWFTAIILILAAVTFFFMLVKSFRYASKIIEPKIHKVESTAPR
jgi:hypothetical protein